MAENLYHNLRKKMKVIESKVNEMELDVERALFSIHNRVKVLEEHLMSLELSAEGGNDPRDGGWFD